MKAEKGKFIMTENEERIRQLNIDKAKIETIADEVDCAVWEYDIANKSLNHSRKMDGRYSKNNLIIDDFRNKVLEWGIVYHEDISKFINFCDSLDRGDTYVETDIRWIGDNSRFEWFRFAGRTVYGADGKPQIVAGATFNITAKKNGTGLDTDSMYMDQLTHLLTKEYAEEVIGRIINNKQTMNMPKLMILMDIDNFKEINDRWGHVYGDAVLGKFARLLQDNFKSRDVIARAGGDKFLVFCDKIKDTGIAANIAERLLKQTSGFELKENCRLQVSMGMAVFPKDGTDYSTMYRSADIALYHAKGMGNDSYYIFNKMNVNKAEINEEQLSADVTETEETSKASSIAEAERRIFDFSFETISENDNFNDAVSSIFREICLDLQIDVITMIEYDYVRQKANVMSEWYCDIKEDKRMLSEVYTKNWDLINERYKTSDRFIYDRIKSNCPFSDEMDKIGGAAKTVMQIPIFDGDRVAAIINYTVYKKLKLWNYSETAALISVTKMISSYYLKLRSRQELESETRYNSAAMEAQKSIYYAVNEKLEIIYLSNYASDALAGASVGKKCYESVMGCDGQCEACPLRGINEDTHSYSTEIYSEKDDSWKLLSAVSLKDNGEDKRYLICITDVTGFLTRVKFTDQLTGVMNYDRFTANAVKSVHVNDMKYAIAFTGIRNFSQINDEFGYTAGDVLLKKFADAVSQELGEHELIGRIKGDDFLILLKYDQNISETYERLKDVFDDIEMTVKLLYPNMQVNIICGIYAIRNMDYSFTTAIDKAAKARREAVKDLLHPQSIFIYSKEYEERIKSENEFEMTMREALANGEFRVFIQPKVALADGNIGGGEALVRWVKPDGTLIPPGRFIPLFERNGFVLDIDNRVYEILFEKMHEWMKEGKKVPQLSVNVSRLHLIDERFPTYFSELVDQYDIPHELVEIEITESVFFDNIEHMINMISKLRAMKFPISMDDFGTGYSTLNLMKSMPIDILKIDGGFFLKCPLDEKNKAVISAIIHLGHSLDLKIVAEGIETEEQDDFIAAEHCDYAQGYLHYKPIDIEEFGKLI